MLQNLIPFAVVLFLTGLFALVWWFSGVPPITSVSRQTNEFLLICGAVFADAGGTTVLTKASLDLALLVAGGMVALVTVFHCFRREEE
jgi:hypothetical protein